MAIASSVVNFRTLGDELLEVFMKLNDYYNEIQNQSDEAFKNIELIIQIIEEIINSLEKIKNSDNPNIKSSIFPERQKKFTGIVFNRECMENIKLSDNLADHFLKTFEMLENSDRLSYIINENYRVILDYKIFLYKGCNLDETIINEIKYSLEKYKSKYSR